MTKSNTYFEEAKHWLPGGVNSPVRAFQAVGRDPLFIQKAYGSHIEDVDGKTYIDYVCSWGPGIVGHAHPRVIEAVQKAVTDGLTFGAPTQKETILAQLIHEAMPSMEMMRLVSSGTEAVMSAIRVARGYTKRDKIIKFRGCYHGHSDGLLVKAGSGALTQGVPDSLGVPSDYTKHTLVAEYNDLESVQALFEQYPEEIACIIVEPVAANMGVVPPASGFLEGLRQFADQYGAVLIFDEVITGFRLGFGGAQAYYGVTPDITTLGKIVGGGMPMAAYGGRKEIMELVAPLGGVYQAGTLSGNPIATAAGIATLQLLKEDPSIYTDIDASTSTLEACIKDVYQDRVWVNRVGSLMSVFFTPEKVVDYTSALTCDTDAYANYFNAMLEKGIYLAPSQFEAMFVSHAHTKEDIEATCKALSTI